MCQEEIDNLKKLQNTYNIITSKPDKGNRVLIANRSDCGHCEWCKLKTTDSENEIDNDYVRKFQDCLATPTKFGAPNKKAFHLPIPHNLVHQKWLIKRKQMLSAWAQKQKPQKMLQKLVQPM